MMAKPQSAGPAPAAARRNVLTVLSLTGAGALGLLYGGTKSFQTGSYLPLSAGLIAGLCLGALSAVLATELRAWMAQDKSSRWWLPIAIYLIALVGLAGASGSRLAKPSKNNHFVYLADSLNHGTLAMRKRPPHGNDWAKVVTIELRDGTKIKGRAWKAAGPHFFRKTNGEVVEVLPQMIRRRKHTYYVSFPPLPAALMMPGVALSGYDFNDVWFTILLAALNPVLCFFLLEKLKRKKISNRTRVDNLWLTLFMCFGTVHFYCAVLGQVWYTAQTLGVTLVFGYLIAAIDARHPLLCGLFIGLGFITRTPILFAFPFFVLQALRAEAKAPVTRFWDHLRGVQWKPFAKKVALFALPIALIGIYMAALNAIRFENPFEFGHTYLNIRWAGRIQRWGLFNIHYLPRNLAAAFTLLPHIKTDYPYVIISRHGLSLFLTTPLLLYVVWPKVKTRLFHACWLAIAPMALVHFLYQNSGFVQFTYRFSLDYTPFLIVLLALSGRRLAVLAKVLILWSLAIHGFGALSFDRWHQFYARANWLFVAQ
jgi:hypothetical protein